MPDAARAQICYGGLCYRSSRRRGAPGDADRAGSHRFRTPPIAASTSATAASAAARSSPRIDTGLVLTCSHLFDTSRHRRRVSRRHPLRRTAGRTGPGKRPGRDFDSPARCGAGRHRRWRVATDGLDRLRLRRQWTIPAGEWAVSGACKPSARPFLRSRSAARCARRQRRRSANGGRLVGVVWGCRDGETYLTCGRPLRRFLNRVQGERASARGQSAETAPNKILPTIDWQASRDEIDSRLAALDAKKQDRGDYLQAGDLNNTQQADVAQRGAIIRERIESCEPPSSNGSKSGQHGSPGFFNGLTLGKTVAGALGLSGPLALAVMSPAASSADDQATLLPLDTRNPARPRRGRYSAAAATHRARVALRPCGAGRLRPRPSMGPRASRPQISRRNRSPHDARLANQTATRR